jgi:propionaldehyde dehydrogenase
VEIDENQIEKIVRGVVENLFSSSNASSLKVAPSYTTGDGLFEDINDAIAAAKKAQEQLIALGKEARFKIIESIKEACLKNCENFARLTVDETKMGRYEDKILKNKVAVEFTPGPEELGVKSYSNESGTVIIDRAPFGVIGAITPMTNPTPGVINNSIIMISAGNSIVFLPHPDAHNCTMESFKVVHEAIIKGGGPANLITAARKSKIENVSKIFKSSDISMICTTGGPGIVRLSMKSGKKVIGAGPGNPPVIVDDTADIEKAANDIMEGGSFDNNILCNEEKVIICTRNILEKLLSAFGRNKTIVLNSEQAGKVADLVVKDGKINKDYMGKDISKILSGAGINVDLEVRLAVFVADNESHPLVQHEQLMPVIPILVVDSFRDAVDTACRVEHGFKHTSIIHSKNIERITEFGQAIDTTALIVNGGSQTIAREINQGGTSWTIAGSTGEGCTTPTSFTRERKIVINDSMNFIK